MYWNDSCFFNWDSVKEYMYQKPQLIYYKHTPLRRNKPLLSQSTKDLGFSVIGPQLGLCWLMRKFAKGHNSKCRDSQQSHSSARNPCLEDTALSWLWGFPSRAICPDSFLLPHQTGTRCSSVCLGLASRTGRPGKVLPLWSFLVSGAAIINCHHLMPENNRNLFCHSYGAQKSKIKVLVGLSLSQSLRENL